MTNVNETIAAFIAARAPEGRYGTHSPFSLAFEQSERELGEKLGYPALVYGDETAELQAKLSALTKAANLAYDALDWQLECWKVDEGDAPPSDLLNAHAALYGLLRYAKDPEDNGVDLPF